MYPFFLSIVRFGANHINRLYDVNLKQINIQNNKNIHIIELNKHLIDVFSDKKLLIKCLKN